MAKAPQRIAIRDVTDTKQAALGGVQWTEIDLKANVWTVPDARMKSAKEHRVPLTGLAKALLGEPGPEDSLVFSSPNCRDYQLSDMAFRALLKKMGWVGITVHGFRSTFRDWAGETTAFPREVVEAALAHQLKDKAEAAYARGDLFDKRKKVMQSWETFISKS